METKTCKRCERDLPIKSFALLKGRYRRSICSTCREIRDQESSGEKRKEAIRRRAKERRQTNVAQTILNDCRASDKKKGRLGNDLDIGFVEASIRKGCFYCSNHGSRMTLDRVDNERAHCKDNVVPSCFRCNHIRNSMPYKAWMVLVPAVRKAQKLGLFGDWRAKPFGNVKGSSEEGLRSVRIRHDPPDVQERGTNTH